MSYIRTNLDEVYRVLVKEGSPEYTKYYPDFPAGEFDEIRTGEYIFWTDVVKESDNVSDLCDCIVYTNMYGDVVVRKLPLNVPLRTFIKDMKHKLINDPKLALFTKKGIKYVANVDKNGDTELIYDRP